MDAFLAELREGTSIGGAAKLAGVSRRTVYNYRESDPEFRAAWDEALDHGTDALEDEAVRRAKDGTDKPVYQKGACVGHVREYSDTLLIFLLKARRPDKFRERVDVKHSGEVELSSLLADDQPPTPEQPPAAEPPKETPHDG